MTTNIIAKWSLTALMAIAPAFAQNNVEATIPFDFTVGKTKMTAGAYTVRSIAPGTIQVVRDDSKASAFVITNGVKIEGVIDNADLPEAFEAAKAFDVMEFIHSNLDEPQRVAVRKLMEVQP